MTSNTISVTPIPLGTTEHQIRTIFHAFSVKNVHIDFPLAYVEFHDEGDLENLDIQFDNYEVAELNNARIDKSDFNWASIKKQNTSPDKKSDSSSSDNHQDLMAADIDHLIVVENCDELFLKSLTEENIRELFRGFHSVNRIVKRRRDVIIEFTDPAEMEQLQTRFPGFNIAELGWNSTIEKADPSKISASEFVQEWSKDHTKESMITQATSQLGYGEKPSSGELPKEKKVEIGSGSKPVSQEFLHQDIIPPFDKKTSMEVNFLNEQSKLGFKEEKPEREAIHEATTNQELDYTTEIKIENNEEEEDRFGLGYEAAEKQRLAEIERQRVEAERVKRENQEREEKRRREEEERKQKERILREEEERVREQKRREEEQRERERRFEEQKRRKEEQERQERIRREQEEAKKREEQEKKRRQEQERARIAQEEQRKRREEERLDRELKEKLEAQRIKYQRQEEERNSQQFGYHGAPTDSEIVAKETEFIKEAGKTIEEQLGYAVNKAKEESANLVNAGLNILRQPEQKIGYKTQQAEEKPESKKESGNFGYDKPEIKEKKAEELGFEKKSPQQVGFDLLNSSMAFLKGSYNKIQETIGTISKEVSNPSELGYEKWTVKPDVEVTKPVVGKQPRVLKTLVTITLLIWVIFLLMQDTCQNTQVIVPEREIEIQTAEVTQQEVPVSINENI